MKNLIYSYRAIWITVIAWFGLIILNQVLRGFPIVPPELSPRGFIILNLVIGLLLGGIFWFIGAIIATLKDMQK